MQAEPGVPLSLGGMGVIDGVVALRVVTEVAERFRLDQIVAA